MKTHESSIFIAAAVLLGACQQGVEARETPAKAIAVTAEPRPGVFHHLDSAGRKNIAVSGDRVAIVWEDNRDGQPRIYLTSMTLNASAFERESVVSTTGEAYEPAIAGLGKGVFLLAWEEDGTVYVRAASATALGAPLRLSTQAAGHVSLDARDGAGLVVWRQQRGSYPALQFSRVSLQQDLALHADPALPVESAPPAAPQLYPSVALGGSGPTLAWEDRRSGHTRLLVSQAAIDGKFEPPEELNEFYANRNVYDKGNGVTRVALTEVGTEEKLAVWMDKRRPKKGYAIYAAFSGDGGESFGPNELVQSAEGDALPHYNPAVAGNAQGQFVVAWDDYRSGTSDIWLSSYSDDLEWGADTSPGVASGPGEQTNPSVVMDSDGRIHLAWVSRSAPGKPSQIWYTALPPL